MSADPGIEPRGPRLDAESPWIGLHSFTEETSSFFFGRKEELKALFERVSYRQLVVFFGRSGLGKSSLIKAALIPQLRHAKYLPVWIRLNYDTDTPLERQVIDALQEHWFAKGAAVPAEWSAPETNLWLLFHLPKFGLLAPNAPQVVLIFDQFEEIFTKGARRPEAAEAFADALAALVENRTPPSVQAKIEHDDALAEQLDYNSTRCKTLLSLRDDYLYFLERWRKRMPSVMENRMELEELHGPQALRAVIEPGTFRPGQPPIISQETGEAIVRFVAKAPEKDTPLPEIKAVPPPLLSLLCEQLNARRLRGNPPAGQIEIGFEELKGQSEDILQSYYLRCLDESHPALQIFIEDTLLSLDGTTRERVSEARAERQLVEGKFSPEEARKTLRRLVEEERLLSVDVRGGQRLIELTHDVLIGVVRKSRELREEKEKAQEAVRSQEAEAAEKQRLLKEQARTAEEQLRKKVTGVVTILALLATLCACIALYQAHSAVQAEKRSEAAAAEAEKEKQIATMANARSDFLQAEALIRTGDVAEAMPYLARSLRTQPENNPAAALAFSYLPSLPSMVCAFQHLYQIHSANFSPNGKYVVTASADDTARVWDATTGQPVSPVLHHQGEVHFANFSSDGKYVVTASFDGTAQVWDAFTGKKIGQPMLHTNKVYSANFSPDGKWVVTASSDHTARVWNAMTGKAASKPLRHLGEVRSASFSPDGKWVVTASVTAKVWDWATGTAISQMEDKGWGWDWIYSAKFSPDGNRIVTASVHNMARVWDARTGQPISPPLPHQSAVYFACFSPGGDMVATASNDGTARVWDAQTGQPLSPPLRHQSWVDTANFSPDGKWLVTASGDHTAQVWDIHNARKDQSSRPIFSPLRHLDTVWVATFSPDGQRILTASFDQTARVWRIPSSPAYETLLVHKAGIVFAKFSPDGKRVVTASDDNTARVWNAQTGEPISPPLQHTDAVTCAKFNYPDGNWVVTASKDNTARVWDAEKGTVIAVLHHQGAVTYATFDPDGKRVVTASDDGTARVWDGRTGQPISPPLQHTAAVNFACFSPDGKWVATASDDGTARVWDAQTGQPVSPPIQHADKVNYACFSFNPNGKWLVTASNDTTARVWDAQTGQPVSAPMPHQSYVESATFSPDGRRVVTASADRTARVWDAQTGAPISAPLQHLGFDVNSARFNWSGNKVVTASSDGTARVWDVGTGQPISQPFQHSQLVQYAEFSPGGMQVLTASQDGSAAIWDLAPDEKAPDWLPDVLEAVSYESLDSYGSQNTYSTGKYAEVRRERLSSTSSDPWEQFGRWLFSDSGTRTISPWSPITLTDYAHRLMDENTPASWALAGQLCLGRPDLQAEYAARAPAVPKTPKDRGPTTSH